jgi:hypothetical protein
MQLKITFEIEKPKCTDAQLGEWLNHRLGASKTISADNPLARTAIAATSEITIEPVKTEDVPVAPPRAAAGRPSAP